jgi:hypothetical protein
VPVWLIPIVVLGALVFLLAIVVVLGRVRGGKYLRPVVAGIAKVPFLRRQMMKASVAALERENPDLASAMKKVQTFGTPKTPEQAQKLLNRLTPAERKAYIAAVGEQQEAMPEPANRQQRRAMQRMQQTGNLPVERRRAPKGGGGRKRK